jgi:hypothetical protein
LQASPLLNSDWANARFPFSRVPANAIAGVLLKDVAAKTTAAVIRTFKQTLSLFSVGFIMRDPANKHLVELNPLIR